MCIKEKEESHSPTKEARKMAAMEAFRKLVRAPFLHKSIAVSSSPDGPKSQPKKKPIERRKEKTELEARIVSCGPSQYFLVFILLACIYLPTLSMLSHSLTAVPLSGHCIPDIQCRDYWLLLHLAGGLIRKAFFLGISTINRNAIHLSSLS